MCYDIGIIRKENHKVSNWDGGTTTQLLIYPKDAVYIQRNFKWRISSAKVEKEESVFTSLPGISRIIMVIDGKIKLEHEGHHNIILNKFEQDGFSGDWNTKSYGKVTDFNLMMAKNCNGKLENFTIKCGEERKHLSNDNIEKDVNCSRITEAFYCVNGEVEIECDNGEKLNIFTGDLFYINKKKSDNKLLFKFINNSCRECNIIESVICY